MLTIAIPLLAVFVSALVYALASQSKTVELARLTFWGATFVTLWIVSSHLVKTELLTILVPALTALVTALVYALAENGKLVELARLTFSTAMLVTFWVVAGKTLHF